MIAPVARWADRLIAWRSGRRYPEYLAESRRIERLPRDEFVAWQWERLRALLRYAHDNVPYWRAQFDRLGARPEDFTGPDHLRLLPALTKDDFQRRAGELASASPPDGRITRSSTGGSTGRNIWFLIDADTHDRRRAAGRLVESWDGVAPGTRTATLWGASLDATPSRGARLYDRLTNRMFLSAYGVGDAELADYMHRLQRFRPEVIVSYPSILLHAARRAGRERCRRLGVRLIYCSAEALFAPVREELADLFGAEVRNRYASREFGMIAGDCPAGGGLHLMEQRLHVELLPGELGGAQELLITDLDNRATPFLRYRIEDLGVALDEPCPCGRPFRRLASVEGRVLDVVVTPEGRAFGGTFFTLTLRPASPAIRQFQVVQDRIDHLRVRIVPAEGYDAAHRSAVRAALARALGPSMRIDLEECAEIAPLPSGKRRFVVSELERASAGPR
ncbi:MAG: phenylacetate--CoA ligase family protein [Acidobacteria bacterium]|nr:phenylacetate--CoA ligase family protein [Acidobacteriota bacterium]